MAGAKYNVNALKSEIRAAIINHKVNACPMIIRLAWHSSGTFDNQDSSGGSNGAGMRFSPEASDGANAGLSIARDMLLPVKQAHPELSYSDLWTLAGSCALEFLGGPKDVFTGFGRVDSANESSCPANGRLPDAAQGAEHLRDVFYRMGFNDQEIVALSGAHTLGSCHISRSGFDGPWTANPLKFDNAYFKHLMHQEWKPRKWDGPLQYEDDAGLGLMMLPTDIALKMDPQFCVWAKKYAKDQDLFFEHFDAAFSKLMNNGVSHAAQGVVSSTDEASHEFREACMHGYEDKLRKLAPVANVHSIELSSGRTALHKAAFWGHTHILKFLLTECKIDPNVQDIYGDTALHDATKLGHVSCVLVLLQHNADKTLKNKTGQTATDVALAYEQPEVVKTLATVQSKL